MGRDPSEPLQTRQHLPGFHADFTQRENDPGPPAVAR